MEHKLVPRSIYYWGDNSELELARRLAYDEAGADKRRKGLVRDATCYDVIEPEACDRVVILSSVPPWTADKVVAAYGNLVPIERRKREEDEDLLATADQQPVLPILADITNVTMAQLRRLTNRQLHDLATRAGIDLGAQAHRDRMSIMNAILETSERRQLASSSQ